MKNGFTIIICCYNSAERLSPTLKYISRLQNPDNRGVEVMVIDNASTDETAIVAKNLWESLSTPFPLRILSEPVSGLSNARMLGILNATFEYLIFCDDDNWLEEGYLTQAAKILDSHPSIGMLGGVGHGYSEAVIPPWSDAFQIYGCGPQAPVSGEVEVLYGAGVILRKSAFHKLIQASYHFILPDRKKYYLSSGGDYELSYAIRLAGYQLWYQDTMSFLHFLPVERFTSDYVMRFIRESTGALNILNTYLLFIRGKAERKLYFYLNLIFEILHHGVLLSTRLIGGLVSPRKGKELPSRYAIQYHKYRLIHSLKFLFNAEKTYQYINSIKLKLSLESNSKGQPNLLVSKNLISE
ncbi:MAG TPA: glycosyltransferase [Chitinophagaceae bacterium]|nr:glycosyltransferase [Chitinophagaceae bacterium]